MDGWMDASKQEGGEEAAAAANSKQQTANSNPTVQIRCSTPRPDYFKRALSWMQLKKAFSWEAFHFHLPCDAGVAAVALVSGGSGLVSKPVGRSLSLFGPSAAAASILLNKNRSC